MVSDACAELMIESVSAGDRWIDLFLLVVMCCWLFVGITVICKFPIRMPETPRATVIVAKRLCALLRSDGDVACSGDSYFVHALQALYPPRTVAVEPAAEQGGWQAVRLRFNIPNDVAGATLMGAGEAPTLGENLARMDPA